jgi:hypothetical protein
LKCTKSFLWRNLLVQSLAKRCRKCSNIRTLTSCMLPKHKVVPKWEHLIYWLKIQFEKLANKILNTNSFCLANYNLFFSEKHYYVCQIFQKIQYAYSKFPNFWSFKFDVATSTLRFFKISIYLYFILIWCWKCPSIHYHYGRPDCIIHYTVHTTSDVFMLLYLVALANC